MEMKIFQSIKEEVMKTFDSKWIGTIEQNELADEYIRYSIVYPKIFIIHLLVF